MLNSKMAVRRHASWLLIVCAALPLGVHAQEVEKKWTSMASFGQTRATENAVQADIEKTFESYQAAGPFSWYVKSQAVAKNKTIYAYRVKPAPVIRTEWKYKFNQQEYLTEEAMINAIKSSVSNAPQCPAAKVTPGPWTGMPGGGAGAGADGSNTGEDASYRVEFNVYDSAAATCTPLETSPYVQRTRTVKCPNTTVMKWSAAENACTMAPAMEQSGAQLMSYSSGRVTQQCPVGNPCEPTTGDKSQPEPDLDLGWIRFARHYHSMTTTAGGAFGHGWTHSHNLRLAIGTDPTVYPPPAEPFVGLIEADGGQIAFQKVGTDYEADDGSGDRLVKQGQAWRLFRATEALDFGANGLLQARTFEDGTTLSYVYDGRGRLLSITHASGRSLLFHYESAAGDDLISALSVAGQLLASYSYTANGQVASVTYAGGGTRSYHYEDIRFPNYLTGVTAEDARRYSWYGYDAKGRVTCSRHSGDCTQSDVGIDGVRLEYTTAGTTIVTDALGKVSTFALTASGSSGLPRKVSGVADPRGAESRAYYTEAQDFRRRLNTVTDRRGTQAKYVYSAANDAVSGQPVNIQTTTEALGLPEQRISETHTDTASNRAVLSRVGNRETRITRNARLQPTSIAVRDMASNDVRITTLTYCEAADVAAGGSCPVLGLLKGVDGPRSDVADTVTYAYYATDDAGCSDSAAGSCQFRKGDLHTLTNALGQSAETLSYDPVGRPLSIKDANGVVTDYTYHPRGWPTSVTVRGADAASDRGTQLSYWPTGQVQEITEPDGSTVTYVYDAAQRLTDIADNTGNTVHYTLDSAGNRLKEDTVDTGGTLRRTLARVYNTLGELTTLKDAGNHATGFAYDANDNLQAITDALQRVSTQQHDPLNRLARTLQDVDGVAAEIRSTYNALDQVTQVTDPKGLHTSYAYNGFGDLTAQTSPDSGSTAFTVDAAGNRTTRTDARGVTATFHYDALNRLTGIAYPDPNLDVGYSYDLAPSVCAADERFTKGRLGTVLHAGGSTAYCHDRFGQVTRKVQTVNGVATSMRYAYTKAGRLAALTYPDGSVADYVRDTQGRISQIGLTRPSQARQLVVSQVTHAAFGPATGWTYGNGRQLQRPLDLDYRPQAVHDPAAGGLSLSYGYDPVGAITELKNGTGTSVLAKYGYDTLGRLTQTKDGATDVAIETYAYDATGNRTALTTAAGTASYTYPMDSHRLLAVDGEARNHDAAGNTISIGGKAFSYSDANRMNAVKQAGTVVESYTYNHRGERVLRVPASGEAQLTVYDEAGQWIGNYSATGQPLQQAIWLDSHPVALISSPNTGVPEVAYIQPDHLGTPRVVIDPLRDVAIWEWSSKSEVFGNQAPSADPDGDGVVFELALRFPGQQATDASGMFYNYQRDYDPVVGRYPQSDPIGLAGGISTFGYVQGDPVYSWDSYGLQSSMRQAIGRTSGMPPYLPANQGGFDPDRPGFESAPQGPIIYPGDVLLSAIQIISTMYPALPMGINVLASVKEPRDARDPNGAKAPGLPGEAEGYCPGKKGPEWARSPNGRGYGWKDESGNVWIPTGPKTDGPSDAHGGPHWDVQLKRGGYINKYPGGHTR